MPNLSVIERDPTLDALKQQLVRDNPPQQRVYLGGSVIGRECERQHEEPCRSLFESLLLLPPLEIHPAYNER